MPNTLIDIVYLDGTETVVKNDLLDILIATEKIAQFKRAEGWVNVDGTGVDLRNYRSREIFPGHERRAPWPEKNSCM